MNFRFDGNEWFVVACSIVLLTYVWIIRKHFQPMLMLILWVYNLVFVATLDYALAATPFHLYDCMDNATYEPMAAYAHAFLYTPYSFIFLYYYDKWSINRNKRVLLFYLSAWTCIALFFEWISLKFGFLDYGRGWKMTWSVPTYPLSALLTIRVYRFIKDQLVNHPFRPQE
ncbi:hypothetical protein [Paenibacillus methanolicus]|uniref:Uncharacterized protein n=1 Tax=Paenibacillus methanolicus TaxID=582686 RepID=A0A5S5C1D0_9BACL|nr:hypothetical protein [Paenibacillus methanolicus]TYP73241.1 hypothetical protein BCM02_107225 [Paenibacillus methanolicus]